MSVSIEVQDKIESAKTARVKHLYLNYQHLKELPQELLELDKVENIFLKYNNLVQLPSQIWKLKSLVELYLHSNNLQTLPEEIGQVHCLKSLNVSGNNLKSLPSTIGNLSKLEDLHVAYNMLNDLPECLGSLQSLKVFDVMNNNIIALPWQLCYCQRLETLLVDGNQIRWIPHQLTQLKHLKELSASRNRLSFVPQDIDQMVLLENLLLDSNTMMCVLPATVLRLDNLVTLGLNRCGNENDNGTFDMDVSRCFQHVRFIGNSLTQSACSLLELSLRASYILLNSSFRPTECLVPSSLASLLTSPTGHCFHCKEPFFVGLFGLTTDLNKASKITRNYRHSDLRTKLRMVFAVCSFNCLKLIEDEMRDVG